MHGLSAARVLQVWEEGAARSPARRALALVTAGGDLTEEAAARLPLARRDAALLELRRVQFGDAIDATVECPACNEALDVAVDAAGLVDEEPPDELTLGAAGFDVSFRLPATADVETAAGAGDVRGALLTGLISSARAAGGEVDPRSLPSEVLDAVEAALEDADGTPVAALTCASCGHEWTDRLDVSVFVWEELAALARRVTADVHVLASAYGWSEADVLGLSPARRRLYVEVVTS